MRLIISGGGPLDPELGRKLQGFGWELTIGYGLSETSPILTFNPPDQLRIESVGVALPGVEIRIDDSDTSDRRGEVMARGPSVFDGYLNLPEKTKEVLGDGWFRTGDIGELDGDGYLYLRGRESSMIVLSQGENINPEKVEDVLQAADEVKEAGVLEHDGQLAAVVVPESTLLREVTGDDLRERLEKAIKDAAGELPSHHRPRMLRIALDPLPRTRLGKLRRHKLEELFDRLGEGGELPEAKAEPISPESMSSEDQQLLSDPAARQAWEYLAERFSDLRLTPDSSLAQELGIDSLSWVDLALALQDRAGIELDEAVIGRVEIVRDFLQEVAGASEAVDAGEDLKKQLEDPESLLKPDKQAALNPPGRLRRGLTLLILGLARFLGRILLHVEIRGEFPREGPYIIAPRHLSAVDPLALLPALSRQQLESLYWAGFTGYFFSNFATRAFSRIARVLPIDPGSAPRTSLAIAVACLKRGHGIIWFPEGQRSPDGELQRLRPGIGLVLAAQPVPVIPVWIEGTREIMPPGQRLPHPGRVRVVIGDPILPETYGDEEREIVKTIHTALAKLGDDVAKSDDCDRRG